MLLQTMLYPYAYLCFFQYWKKCLYPCIFMYTDISLLFIYKAFIGLLYFFCVFPVYIIWIILLGHSCFFIICRISLTILDINPCSAIYYKYFFLNCYLSFNLLIVPFDGQFVCCCFFNVHKPVRPFLYDIWVLCFVWESFL